MARVLFVHNQFPGRFEFLLPALKAAGHQLAAIARSGRPVDGARLVLSRNDRANTPGILDLALRAETDLMGGRATANSALELRREGFVPDLIIGHPAWGDTLFMNEVFPRAKQLLVGEFYYRSQGADVGFDAEFEPLTDEDRFRVHAKNATMALAYAEADRIVCPTPFQASVFPPAFRDRISIIHEGVDTTRVRRLPGSLLRLGGKVALNGSTPVITFVNRTFEPLRGFHIVMRALPEVLKAVPNLHVIMMGSDKARGYGLSAPGGGTWRAHLKSELGDRLDWTRVHFTGPVPHETMLAALSISWAHIYYTYPFVLSWSLLEAMACSCVILGSNTPPVRDVICDGVNGLLHDFFDVDALSAAVITACQDPGQFSPLRRRARDTIVSRFDRSRVCLPAWLDTIQSLLD